MNRNQEWQQRQTDRVNNLVLSKMSTAASQNRALNSVLALAGRGWRLFPVAGGGKKPLIRQWPALATPNAETIRNWTNSYPECNWAVACGPASGLWVLDVDGGDGAAAVLELCREHGDDWLETLTVQTKRGQHLYFHCPQDTLIRNSAGKLAPGLDLRGNGGYALVPPSVHPTGHVYQWAGIGENTPIASAPEWLLIKGQRRRNTADLQELASWRRASAMTV